MKLLLAEDEVDMSEALVDILTYHKYTVDAVFDGEEALDYATIGEYDGIIFGINYFLDVSSTLILLLLRLKSKKKRVRMHSVSESIHTLFSVTAKS